MSDRESKENCVGDFYAVWRFTYAWDQDIRWSVPGTGETEKVGTERVTSFFDVLAVSPELATAAYEKEFGWKLKPPAPESGLKTSNFDNHRLISGPLFICYVDATIAFTNGWMP